MTITKQKTESSVNNVLSAIDFFKKTIENQARQLDEYRKRVEKATGGDKRLGKQIEAYNQAYWDKHHEVKEIREVITALLNHLITPPLSGELRKHRDVSTTMAKSIKSSLESVKETKYKFTTAPKLKKVAEHHCEHCDQFVSNIVYHDGSPCCALCRGIFEKELKDTE